jgi:arginyl-tRNA synthetase
MKSYVSSIVAEVLQAAVEHMDVEMDTPSFDVTVPKEHIGDYTTNAAFVWAKQARKNPNEIATAFASAVAEADATRQSAFASVTTAGGFINIVIAPQAVGECLTAIRNGIEIEQPGSGKKIVFEYSSPNTNKALHIGHTRNDVFGMACINLLRATGYEVIACEVINDRGIHIMKSMLMYQLHGNGDTPVSVNLKPDHFVGKYYAMFAREAERDPSLNDKAQELLLKWESGDVEVRALWQTMNTWFYEGVAATYVREGSAFSHVDHESELYMHGKEIVAEGLKRGVFTKEADGSVSVDLSDRGLDKKYLLRADGTSIYITQDMYLWHARSERYHADEMIVTTSVEQSYHFKVLKEIFGMLGYAWAPSFRHLPYEHVNLGNEKMSSRSGNTVSADELLEQVKDRVRGIMLESKRIKGSAEDNELVESVAFAAIKYGYLKYDTNTKIYFDLDETVAVEGNTGPYIQYAHARIRSILAKGLATVLAESSEMQDAVTPSESFSLLAEASEISLARYVLHYAEAAEDAAREYKPSILCSYLHTLASKFNTMYDQVLVLNTEDESLKNARLKLLASAAAVLAHGLGLLGIKAPETL